MAPVEKVAPSSATEMMTENTGYTFTMGDVSESRPLL